MIRTIHLYGRLVKFSHTVFAMPFALSAVVLAHHSHHVVTVKTLLWVVLAMVGARSAAMGFNRWADLRYDRLNPRTASRPSSTGAISARAILSLVILSSLFFLLCTYQLNPLCFTLAFPTLAILLSYSYTKRLTSWCHLYLGFAIGLAPIGAWIAVTGSWEGKILPLSLALLTYIAGFDILYACQDIEFDHRMSLHSLPLRLGVPRALLFSSLLHLVTVGCLAVVGLSFHLGSIYYFSLALISILLWWEHRMVSPQDLSKVPMAFFHINSAVSVAIFIGIGLDVLWRHYGS